MSKDNYLVLGRVQRLGSLGSGWISATEPGVFIYSLSELQRGCSLAGALHTVVFERFINIS